MVDYIFAAPCPDPTPANGTGTVLHKTREPPNDGTFYEGTLMIFECDTAYTLNGNVWSYCYGDGQWSPAPPICEGNNLIMCFQCYL